MIKNLSFLRFCKASVKAGALMMPPEPVLSDLPCLFYLRRFNPILLQFSVKITLMDPCFFFCLQAVAFMLFQQFQNHFFLIVIHHLPQRFFIFIQINRRLLLLQHPCRDIVNINNILRTDGVGTLHHVIDFPHIARPLVFQKIGLNCFGKLNCYPSSRQ